MGKQLIDNSYQEEKIYEHLKKQLRLFFQNCGGRGNFPRK